MSDIVKRFGERVRFFRDDQGLSQEKLAELSGLHSTYIGQIERGEKNCSLESAEKIAKGLNISIEKLMSKITSLDQEDDIPRQVYERLLKLSYKDQQAVSTIINGILDYKDK